MRICFNIDEKITPIRNLSEYLKNNYNLKLVSIIKYLYLHPEIIDQINDDIDEYDPEYRFQNRMK